MESFELERPQGRKTAVFWWPAEQAQATIQLLHGLAEHAKRYDRLARVLNAAGYSVISSNHPGHGELAGDAQGVMPGDDWFALRDDLLAVRAFCQDTLGSTPNIILGHSMGSFAALDLAQSVGADCQALILSGTGSAPRALYRVFSAVAALECWRQGSGGQSGLIHALAFGAYNKAFAPNRTEFDWLSRDDAEVDAYIHDDLCGFHASNGFWRALLSALVRQGSPQGLSGLSADTPVYLLAGDRDPVGDQGKGIEHMRKRLKRAGVRSVDVKLYKDGRHEMFNETNRDEVTQDLVDWLGANRLT